MSTPHIAKRPCLEPRCPNLVTSGRCSQHQRQVRQVQRRHTAGTPGVNYGRRWGKARAQYLAEHPWCVACEAEGKRVLADELDHIVRHEGDYDLFWDEANWQGLCTTHHSAKTAQEVGFSGARR